jgi:hypothetical protein
MCNGWKNRETWLVNIWFGDCWAMMQNDGVQITPEFIREEVEAYVEEQIGAHGFIADMIEIVGGPYDT